MKNHTFIHKIYISSMYENILVLLHVTKLYPCMSYQINLKGTESRHFTSPPPHPFCFSLLMIKIYFLVCLKGFTKKFRLYVILLSTFNNQNLLFCVFKKFCKKLRLYMYIMAEESLLLV